MKTDLGLFVNNLSFLVISLQGGHRDFDSKAANTDSTCFMSFNEFVGIFSNKNSSLLAFWAICRQSTMVKNHKKEPKAPNTRDIVFIFDSKSIIKSTVLRYNE